MSVESQMELFVRLFNSLFKNCHQELHLRYLLRSWICISYWIYSAKSFSFITIAKLLRVQICICACWTKKLYCIFFYLFIFFLCVCVCVAFFVCLFSTLCFFLHVYITVTCKFTLLLIYEFSKENKNLEIKNN